jgi:YidC/Oxa1 family membrane protein insertase
VPATAAPPAGSVPAPGPAAAAAAATGPKVTVTTDLYTAEIDTVGGVISLVSLAKHQDATDPTKPYRVLQRNADRVFIAQAGLVGAGWPNHETRWEVLPGPHELAPGSERVELRLQATAADGSKVVQILTFHRGSYVVDVAFDVTNATGQPIAPEAYFQITRDTKHAVVQSSMAPASYVGPVVHSENKKFEKVDFGEIDKMAADPSRKPKYETVADNGWVGMIEHYFVAAWIPPQDRAVQRRFYTTKAGNGLYTAGVRFSEGVIAPGATGELRASLYVGPQDQDVLARTAKGLDLVVDYGIFTVLAVPLFILLKWLHAIIGNWGWAIIVRTIMIKGAF